MLHYWARHPIHCAGQRMPAYKYTHAPHTNVELAYVRVYLICSALSRHVRSLSRAGSSSMLNVLAILQTELVKM